jgi:hypothetical protein
MDTTKRGNRIPAELSAASRGPGTLYRVVHSRDHLLADVLWRLAEHALRQARKCSHPARL